MTNQKFYVAANRTVYGPNTGVKTQHNKETGRSLRIGMPGKKYEAGQELPSGYVEYALTKKEDNGESLMTNLINTGVVVFNHGDVAPEVFSAPLPVERDIPKNTKPSVPSVN